MKWKIFDVFHKIDEDLTNATTEDDMSRMEVRRMKEEGRSADAAGPRHEMRGDSLRGSVAPCEDFGRKARKERIGERKDGTMNHQTTKRPNYQTILARWVAVAAVAAGELVEGAREGETRLQAGVA